MGTKPVKKPHWTQTPEGKKRISEILKAQHANGSRKRKKVPKVVNPTLKKKTNAVKRDETEIPVELFAYVSGRFDALIEHFAQSADVPTNALAAAVGRHLSARPRR
jgi:hypothetical protein